MEPAHGSGTASGPELEQDEQERQEQQPEPPGRTDQPTSPHAAVPAASLDPAEAAVAAADAWQPGVPDLREHLPSIVWGAAFPIGIYFLVRHRVHSDAQALIIAGSASVAWIVIQFIRNRRIDFVGMIVLFGFAIGVASSVLLHGNAYVLKVRDAFFIALFGAACVITVFTHERPTLFYVSRYLSAGNDREKIAAYNQLLEIPVGRRTFKVLSIVWGIGLFAEACFRMVLAAWLPTGTFLAISPAISLSVIGSLFAFTVVYTKRAQLEAAVLMQVAPEPGSGTSAPAEQAVAADAEASPQIPLP